MELLAQGQFSHARNNHAADGSRQQQMRGTPGRKGTKLKFTTHQPSQPGKPMRAPPGFTETKQLPSNKTELHIGIHQSAV